MDIPRNWTFEDSGVAAGFDRHVREQLPWYDLATDAISHVARHYIPIGGTVYDIGASTGNIGKAIAPTLKDRAARLISIESSAEMCARYQGPQRDNLIQSDALAVDYEPFDLCICFLVLMFLTVEQRAELLRRLRLACKPGGAIIVFDKCEAGTGYVATVLWRLALAGKVAAGVASDEIVAKELSLIGIQRPVSPSEIGGVEWFRFGEFAGWIVEP